MFHVVLYEPEIPPNTGNIIRLCANAGVGLHLIHPLGFALDNRQLRRAGLDYHEWVKIAEHGSLQDFISTANPQRLCAVSTRGSRNYTAHDYREGDAFLFGPETRGLPQTVLDSLEPDRVLKIPMQPGSRSMNLSNAVAVVIYEGWRQSGFPQ